MDYVYYLLLLVLLVLGMLVNILGLPGLWLMVASYGAYALATGWDRHVGYASLITLLVLALLAEAVEFFAGAAGSKAAGGRTRGMIGAIVGGFLGAIFLSIIPIPVVAQIVGACLGAFIGAGVMEYSDRDLSHSLRVGYGAAKGRLYGIVSKLAFGVAMFVIAMFAGFPIGSATAPAQAATTQPAAPQMAAPPTTAPDAAVDPTTSPSTLPTISP